MKTPSQDEVERTLAGLSDGWSKASMTKDISYFERIWASDFSYTLPDGRVFNKQEGIADVLKDTDTYTSDEVSNFKVRTCGSDFAVTTGDDTAVGRDGDGKMFRRVVRFTNVWVKRNDTWQCVAGHASDTK